MEPADLVVVLPGILGSTLRHGQDLVWAPSAGAALRAIGTFGASIKQLQLPPGIGDDHPGDGVEPAALMPDLHVLPGIWTPVKGYDRLLARLNTLGYQQGNEDHGTKPGNLLPVAYDWRLSCRYNGQKLASIVEPALERWRSQGGRHADARIVFICHSMGGLVARWYIEHCSGAEITRKLITLGTPYRGAVRALDQLVNGAHKGLGPFGIDLTEFARSMPSLHQLLPDYACIEQTGDLVRTTDLVLPELDTRMAEDSAVFFSQLNDAETRRSGSLQETHAIVGIRQTTATTARLAHRRIELVDSYKGQNLYGDATVPIVAASRRDVPMDSNTLRRVPDKHGNLHRNPAALDEIEGILTAEPIIVKAARSIPLRVEMPEFTLAGDAVPVRITPGEPAQHALRVTVTSEQGKLVEARVLPSGPSTLSTVIDGIGPGIYTVEVTGTGPMSPFAPVSSDILVWETPEPLKG